MRGAEQFIAYRMKGYPVRDGIVYIDTDPGVRWNRHWMAEGDHAHIVVEPADHLSTIDLRCVYGLTAKVEGHDEARVLAVAEQVKKHAARVLTVVFDPVWFGPHKFGDTKGVMCS